MKKIRKVLVVYYAKYRAALLKVHRAILKLGLSHSVARRENEAAIRRLIGKADAVIVVGGDGTLLRASHFIEGKPVLHISSTRDAHEAFFSRATGKDAPQKLKRLMQGKYKILPLMRLEEWLDGKKLPFKALNEVFIGGKKAYQTVRYELKVGGRTEEQKSSGVIVSTPAGSSAWGKSAGGMRLKLTDGKIAYVVREPYFGRLTKPRLTKGIIGASGSLKIKSNIWQGGIVVIDSYKKEFPFKEGSTLIVKASRQPLNLVYF